MIRLPKVIVFDKDGTLGEDSLSLSRWVEHIEDCLIERIASPSSSPPCASPSFSRKKLSREHMTCDAPLSEANKEQKLLESFHQLIGWDTALSRPSDGRSLVARGSYTDVCSATAELLLSFDTTLSLDNAKGLVLHWHEKFGDVHSHDRPIANLDLHDLMSKIMNGYGIQLAICTMDERASTEAALKRWGIRDLLSSVVTATDVGEQGKPSPYPLTMICSDLNVSEEEVWVIGDTIGDIKMGRAGGAALTIGVLSGSGFEDELLQCGADMLMGNVGEVLDLLSKAE